MDSATPGLSLTLADEAQALAAANAGARAKAAGANNVMGAGSSGAVPTLAPGAIGGVVVNITPKVSGKLLVQWSAIIDNGAGSTTGITPAVGHALHSNTPVADFIANAAIPIAAGSNGLVVFQEVIAGLTVGTSYDVAAMAQASQTGATVSDLRLYVQELAG
jgi:hypothetical protein